MLCAFSWFVGREVAGYVSEKSLSLSSRPIVGGDKGPAVVGLLSRLEGCIRSNVGQAKQFINFPCQSWYCPFCTIRVTSS